MTAALRIEHVGKVFGAGEIAVRAVDDVSLSVAAGEMVLVMGPSGSGKTTLLSIAGALLAPDEGRVWIAGHEATSLDERALPELRLRSVGFIFQTANLLANLTASENVELVLRAAGARRAEARRHARDLLVELGLAKRLASLPEKLSGGERQRVAIARALANEPALLLADEPTANLDSRTGYEVMHTLELLAKEHGRSLVAVTHDSRIADVADRVLWLEDGRLSEQPAAESAAAVDPVCGMTIAIDRAAASRLRNDETLYFCSTVCAERFDRSRAIVVR